MRLAVLALFAAALVACKSGQSEGQKKIEDLTARINDLRANIEKGKTELQNTIKEHDAIANTVDGDLIGHYKKFSKGIERVEKQREEIRDSVEKVRAAATPYFDQWKADLAKISEEGLRKRSEERMNETRARYQDVHKIGEEAKAAYDPLMATLKNHHAYWASDLNAASAASLKGDTEKIDGNAQKLYGLMDKVVEAAKKYNDSVAMRTAPPAPEKPAEGGKK
jgi:chromosome segregation ATPase